ncbi:hypothetical protein AAG570_011439 [Ranatra chinensis]|uniref:Transmembrane protein n=1 Tax=Ranatra chinensis TaxID=642074 RepID=A0ABD0YYV3_9HEMI
MFCGNWNRRSLNLTSSSTPPKTSRPISTGSKSTEKVSLFPPIFMVISAITYYIIRYRFRLNKKFQICRHKSRSQNCRLEWLPHRPITDYLLLGGGSSAVLRPVQKRLRTRTKLHVQNYTHKMRKLRTQSARITHTKCANYAHKMRK